MTTGVNMVPEQNMEKQMEKQMGGCMAGFFNLFDRNSLLNGKRVYAKRLPSSSSTASSAIDSASEPVSTIGSPATLSRELDKPLPPKQSPSPKPPQSPSTPISKPADSSSPLLKTPPPEQSSLSRSPATPESPSKSPLSFEFKEGVKSPWKFTREAPRLSLDSRAITDAKGSLHPREISTNSNSNGNGLRTAADDDDESERQRRSPSVIARLMGLEPTGSNEGGGGGGGATRGGGGDGVRGSMAASEDKKSQLRRSASESRSRDLLQYHRYVDSNYSSQQQLHTEQNLRVGTNSVMNRDNAATNFHPRNSIDNSALNVMRKSNATIDDSGCRPCGSGASPLRVGVPKSGAMRYQQQQQQQQQQRVNCNGRALHQRKSYYDTADFFPEPKQTNAIYGEIERRLKMRGIDEPSKDLETLKQILEALQLKGLLHSKQSDHISRIQYQQQQQQLQLQQNRNYVYDRRYSYDESPIVVMKPSRTPVSRRLVNDSPPSPGSYRSRAGANRRGLNFSADGVNSPRRAMPMEANRNARSPVRNGRSSSPPLRRPIENRSSSPVGTRRRQQQQGLSVDTARLNETTEQSQSRRVSPVQSPRMQRGVDQNQTATTRNRSPRSRRPTVEIYRSEKLNGVRAEDEEASTISESSFSTSSHTDTEKSKMDEYKEGRILLDRCDKLLRSISEITSSSTTSELQQPSPVSVLDSSFYKEDSSPSPVMKRTIDFKDQVMELEEEAWSPSSSSAIDSSDDPDFTYVSEILRAATYFPHEDPTTNNLFQLLEKQQSLKGKDTSKISKLERRLIFDTITEILGRNQQLPPWKTTAETSSLHKIWNELQTIRDKQKEDNNTTEDLFESICGILKKDFAGDSINGWNDPPVEMSEAVLDIERLIFKDLIGETIRDLASFSGNSSDIRRKLVF